MTNLAFQKSGTESHRTEENLNLNDTSRQNMANYIPAPEVDPSLSFQKFCERYQSDILKVCPGSTIEEDDSTFYILTPHRITAKELCVPTTFENSPVVVEYSPKLGALNPDYTDITLGQIIFDGAPCGTKEWRNAIQLSFFEEHKSALWQCGSFYLTIKKKKGKCFCIGLSLTMKLISLLRF